MSENSKTKIIYPNLQLDIKGSKCIVNYYYPDYILFPKGNFEKFRLPNLFSLQDFSNLLDILDKQSKNQKHKIYISLKKQSSHYTVFLNNIRKMVDDPLSDFFSVLSSQKNEEPFFENLEFDDGLKILLMSCEIEKNSSTSYIHKTKDGSPDLRYKNNLSYDTYYSIKVSLPGEKLLSTNVGNEQAYLFLTKKIKKKYSFDKKIKHIKLGREISVEKDILIIQNKKTEIEQY